MTRYRDKETGQVVEVWEEGCKYAVRRGDGVVFLLWEIPDRFEPVEDTDAPTA